MSAARPEGECPSLYVLEMVADGSCTDGSAVEHVETCEACGSAVEEIRRNREFLARFAGDSGPEEDPRSDAGYGDGASGEGPSGRRAARRPTELVRGYQIAGELARGGQGVVYRAVQLATHRKVALKIPSSDALATARGRRRFEREISVIAGLKHPYIVTLYDRGVTMDGRFFIAMEYISGERLDRWAERIDNRARGRERDKRTAAEAKIEIIAKVCEAVQYAHQRGIMHRDLKPGNILVDGEDRPRLLDFGIARLLLPGGLVQTVTGDFVGTWAYASPEQVGADDIDTRTDVYSLGVVMYEMLTGRLPYPLEGTVAERIHAIQHLDPLKPWAQKDSPLRGLIDEELETILLKALAKERERRYQSAAELGLDLRRYLAGEAIEAKRDSTWYVIRKSMKRHRTLAVSSALVLAAVGAGIGFAAYGAAEARAAREQAKVEQDRAAIASEMLGRVMPPAALHDRSPGSEFVWHGISLLFGKLEFGLVPQDPSRSATWQAMGEEVLRANAPQLAEISARYALMNVRAAVGERHERTARAMHDLAEVLQVRGRLPEAEEYARRSLEIQRGLFGSASRECAEGLTLLSRVVLARGSADQSGEQREEHAVRAGELAEEACQVAAGLEPAEPIVRAAALEARALVRAARGSAGEAEKDIRAAVTLRLRAQDDDDPGVARCLEQMADLADKADGGSSEVMALARAPWARAMEVDEAGRVGVELRGVARSLRRLPDAEGKTRPFSWALRRVLALKRELLKPDDPAIGRTLLLLGWALQNDKDWAGSEEAFGQARPYVRRSAGEDSFALANCLEYEATALAWQGKFKEAARASQASVEIWLRRPKDRVDPVLLIPNHRSWVRYIILAAEAKPGAAGQGLWREAEQQLRACVENARTSLGESHHLYGGVLNDLGWVLANLSVLPEAERSARDGLAILERNSATPGDQLLVSRLRTGRALALCGKHDDAERLLLLVWSGDARCTPAPKMVGDDQTWRVTARTLVEVYRARGSAGDAESAKKWERELAAPAR